jgi:hypothetical protein
LQVDPDRSDAGFRLRLHYSKYLFDFEVAALAAENHLIDGYGDQTTIELARLASMTPDERHGKVAASVAAAKANASLFAGAELLEEQHVGGGSRMMSQHQLLMPVEAVYDDIPKLLPAILAPLPLKEFSASTVSPLDASPRAPFSFKALHAGTSVPGIAAVGAAGPASAAAAAAKTLLPPVSAIAFDRDSGSGSGSSSKRKFATAATASASLANIATVVERRQSRKKRAVAVDSDDDEDEDDLRKRKLPDYMTLQKALNGAGVGRVRASTATVATKVINVGAADEDDDELSTISAFLERLRGEFL